MFVLFLNSLPHTLKLKILLKLNSTSKILRQLAFGQTHHRIVGFDVVTRQDDPVSQRHEIRGVESFKRFFFLNGFLYNVFHQMILPVFVLIFY